MFVYKYDNQKLYFISINGYKMHLVCYTTLVKWYDGHCFYKHFYMWQYFMVCGKTIHILVAEYMSTEMILCRGKTISSLQKVWLVWFMVFNATFNNISVISWWSVLLVEETVVPGENHRPFALTKLIT